METLTNFRQSTIIKSSKTKEFLKAFNDNRVNKDYWDECQKTSHSISTLNVERLKKLCAGKENEWPYLCRIIMENLLKKGIQAHLIEYLPPVFVFSEPWCNPYHSKRQPILTFFNPCLHMGECTHFLAMIQMNWCEFISYPRQPHFSSWVLQINYPCIGFAPETGLLKTAFIKITAPFCPKQAKIL